MHEHRVEGCTAWCCTVGKLADIPVKPADVAWATYAPHLTGRQIIRLNTRWRAAATAQPTMAAG